MRLLTALVVCAIIATAFAGYDDDGYGDDADIRYKNRAMELLKSEKKSKTYARDQSLDRGIDIDRDSLRLKNKKYDTENYRTRDSLATSDKSDETDYRRSRGGYATRKYESKPYSKKQYEAAPAKYDAPAKYETPSKYPAPAPAKEDAGTDGVLIENENGNKNQNSEKSRQQNKAASANANEQRKEKLNKKLKYKENKGGYKRRN